MIRQLFIYPKLPSLALQFFPLQFINFHNILFANLFAHCYPLIARVP